MYKVILVPLDGSKRAEAILSHVEKTAQYFESAVVFLHVVEPNPTIIIPSGQRVELNPAGLELHINKADAYLAGLQEEFRERKIKATRYVEHGPVVETIIDVATQEDADLIAMASHGRSGLSRVFYGSVTAGVLHRVDRPLLLVRSRGHT